MTSHKSLLACLVGTAMAFAGSQALANKNITLMQLGDVHGHMHSHPEIFPDGRIDPHSGGLAKLTTLINESGLGGSRVEEESVGFKLAPRMNASGRLGHARETVELLLSNDALRCEQIAKELTKVNDERRLLCERIQDEAIERIKIDTRRFAKNQRTWLKRPSPFISPTFMLPAV